MTLLGPSHVSTHLEHSTRPLQGPQMKTQVLEPERSWGGGSPTVTEMGTEAAGWATRSLETPKSPAGQGVEVDIGFR